MEDTETDLEINGGQGSGGMAVMGIWAYGCQAWHHNLSLNKVPSQLRWNVVWWNIRHLSLTS